MTTGGKWTEPARWSDDPSDGPAGAAGLLQGALRPRLPNERELARLEAAVELLARTSTRAQPRFRWWQAFLTRPSRVVAGGAALLLTASMLGAAVALWRTRDWARGSFAEVVPLPMRVAPAVRSPPAGPARAREPNAKPVFAQDRRAPVKRARHPTPSAVPMEQPVDETLLREATLIDGARAALAAEPAHALALLERHRLEAPDGQLAPEREFLSVAALCRLGEIEEASRRAAALDRRKPASTYAARARRLVEAARGVESVGGDGRKH